MSTPFPYKAQATRTIGMGRRALAQAKRLAAQRQAAMRTAVLPPALVQQELLRILLQDNQDYRIMAIDHNGDEIGGQHQEILNLGTCRIHSKFKQTTEQNSPPLIVEPIFYDRGAYSHITCIMQLANNPDIALHEYIHRMQQIYTLMNEIYIWLHEQRTKGDQPARLIDIYPNSAYRPAERTLKDQFPHAYYGKISETGEPTELMPTAIQVVLGYNEDWFMDLYYNDRELLELTIGLLMEDEAKWR